MKKILSILALLAFITLIASCGGGNNPKSVLKKYCNAYEKGDYETCLKLNFTMQVQNHMNAKTTMRKFNEDFKDRTAEKYKILNMIMEEEPHSIKGFIEDGIVYGSYRSRGGSGKDFKYETAMYEVHDQEGKEKSTFHVRLMKITEEIKKEYPLITFDIGDWAVAKKI